MARSREYAGKQYLPGAGTVHLYSTQKRYPATLTDLVDERIRIVEHEALPMAAQYLVTTASLSADIERRASRVNATPVVLPEGADWLRERINREVTNGRDVTVLVHRAADII